MLIFSPFERNAFAFGNYVVLFTPLAIAAVGTTLVLITGGFDLSVAGTISLSNVMAATLLTKYQEQSLLVIVMIVLVGLAIGLLNGILIVLLRLQSLAVTLASFICSTGVALMILPAPGGSVPPGFTEVLLATIGSIPIALLVLVAIGVLWSIFRRTRTGSALFAIGADRPAAVMSGIPVTRSEITAYTVAGGLYAVAGLYLTAVTSSGDPNAGRPFLLTAFAAMALGLVSFRGGAGNAVASILGAASLMTIPKLLFGLGIADFWVGAFQGLIILVALSIPVVTRYLRSRSTGKKKTGAPRALPEPSVPTRNIQGAAT
ncbi:ABC transporter permease [Arthrobacter sp. GCM10027362]|uniref:ABC transporter permease n=1 Tax=Arthrobacter sp. GCM10027362 TaxID=3273379 RepID=UPI003671DE9F